MFVFFLALPNLMGIESVGRFTFWYTVLLVICQPLLDFSLSMIVVKYTARNELAVVRRAFIFGLGFLPVLLLGLYIGAVLLPFPQHLIGLLLIYLGLSLSLNLIFSYFRGLEQLQVEGVIGSLHKMLGPTLLFAFFAMGYHEDWLPALAMAGMAGGGWVLLATLYSGKIRSLFDALKYARSSTRSALSMCREGIALGGVGLVGLLYLRVDVVMLGTMVGPEEVGYYFTASKFVEAAFIAPHVLMLVVFPRLVKATDMRPLMRRMSWILGGLSLVALMGVLALATWVIPFFYDPSLTRISTLMIVLAPTVMPVYLGYLFTQVLVVRDQQNRYLIIAFSGLLLNLVLNALLIPIYQGCGAAISTLITELVITLSAVVTVFRTNPHPTSEIR